LIFLLYLIGPTFFFRIWMNVMFGSSRHLLGASPVDLSSRELILFMGLTILMFWLGVTWQVFLF
jgi:hypothetical protein